MLARTLLIAATLAVTGCVQDGLRDPARLPEVDAPFFRCNVQPVLAARCAFMACHGNATRPLRLYAEQRYRLNPDWREYETPLTGAELEANFQTVRGFIARSPDEAELLLDKPLDTRAGGMYHQGEELEVSEDVFLSPDDPGYVILRDFIDGASASETCTPTEEVGL